MIDKKIYIQYVIIVFLWLLANTVSSSIGFIALFISIFFILKGRDIDVVRFIFFFLPNIRILDVLGFTSGINILLIVCSLKIIFSYTSEYGDNHLKTLIDKRASFVALFVFVIELSHAFLSTTTLSGILFNATNIALDILAGITLLNKGWSIEKFRTVVISFSIGVFSSAVVFVVANPDIVRLIMKSAYRFGAYGTDPNYLSVYVVLSMAGILYISVYEKVHIYEFLILVLLAVVGLLTASKMCLLSMISIFSIYFIVTFIQGKWKQLGKVILGLFPIVLVGIFAFKDYLIIFWYKLLDRFSNTSFTSGRNNLFDYYMRHIWDDNTSFLWGRGVGYFSFYQSKGAEYVAHNTYLDFLLSWGIIGFISFILLMIFAYKEKINIKNHNAIDYIMIIILSVMLLSLSCMSSDMFWFIVPYSFIPLTMYPELIMLSKGDRSVENYKE